MENCFPWKPAFHLTDDLYWKECIALTPRLSSLASLLKPKCIIEKTIENFNSYPVFKRTYPWKKSWLQYVEKRHLTMPNFIFNIFLSKFLVFTLCGTKNWVHVPVCDTFKNERFHIHCMHINHDQQDMPFQSWESKRKTMNRVGGGRGLQHCSIGRRVSMLKRKI